MRAMHRQEETAGKTLEQIARQADLSAKQTTIAEAATAAARSSSEIADRQTRLFFQNERPWIVVNPKTAQNWPLPQKGGVGFPLDFAVDWTLKNVGRTPAIVRKLRLTIRVDERPEPNRLINYGDAETISNFLIAPNGEHSHRDFCEEISETEYDAIKRSERFILFFGYVEYTDTLENRDHISRFCSYWYYVAGVDAFEPVGPEGWTDYT